MADLSTTPVLSVCTTVESKLADLSIQDGRLIFVQDKHKIALDFGGKRIIYRQIEELATEGARTSMLAPVTGSYYFVIETGVLWTYQNGWVRVTPERGVDYWTDEDKAEIKSYVDDAILGGAW